MDADSFHIGAYGGWTDGPWTLSGSLAYAASHVSTERRILFGGVEETARAQYWNHNIGLSAEAAYRFDLGGGTSVSPLFTLDTGWSGHGGFTETGAGALNLTGAAQSAFRFDAGLGVGVAHAVHTDWGRVTLEGRALWEHGFAATAPGQSMTFAGGTTPFTVQGPAAGSDRLRLGAGVSFEAADGLSLKANYSGLFSAAGQTHAVRAGLSMKF